MELVDQVLSEGFQLLNGLSFFLSNCSEESEDLEGDGEVNVDSYVKSMMSDCDLTSLVDTFSKPADLTAASVLRAGAACYHCKQQFSWDCGLACVFMVIKYALANLPQEQQPKLQQGRRNLLGQLNQLLAEYLALRSPLWTIDIYSLLCSISLIASTYARVEMHTTCVGVPTYHRELDWYADQFDNDFLRVQNKFVLAKDIGAIVREQSLPAMTLLEHLSIEHQFAIILVNSNILLDRTSDRFVGHFLFLVQYNADTNQLIYLDSSASSGSVSSIASEKLISAWDCPGTDKDVILLSMCTDTL